MLMNIVRRRVAVHGVTHPPRNRRAPRVTGSPATLARWTVACLPGLLDSEREGVGKETANNKLKLAAGPLLW